MKVTYKVHKVNSTLGSDVVTLHPLDAHEMTEGRSNDLAANSASGDGKLFQRITAPAIVGQFKVGQLVDVEFTIRQP